jgi:hypothetical protein
MIGARWRRASGRTGTASSVGLTTSVGALKVDLGEPARAVRPWHVFLNLSLRDLLALGFIGELDRRA